MIWIGTAGFAYAHWKGSFYPANTPRQLAYYARHAAFVEINSTYYQIPSKATVQGWDAQTPDSFRFAVKLVRKITHTAQPTLNQSVVDRFFTHLKPLDAKLAIVVCQFPPQFVRTPVRQRYLNTVLDASQAHFPGKLFVEVRHPSWFTNEVKDLLDQRGVGFVNTTRWPIPEAFLPADDHYLRLLGDRAAIPDAALGKISLDKSKDLEQLAERLEELNEDRRSIWIIINNRFSGHAIQDAIFLARTLRDRGVAARGFEKPDALREKQRSLEQFL
ncbi:MAG: DUF72 domain-containing protein [Candidatus Heimdallarchaeota archaeon]